MTNAYDFKTRTVHAGEARRKPGHALTTPISQTSLFTFENTADLTGHQEAKLWGEAGQRRDYGRYGNPTVIAAEAKLADLDGAEAACLFSSGMAATTTVLFALLSAGNHIIITDDCYRRTRGFVTLFLKRFGIEATVVPMGDYPAMEAAIRPETRVILSESPTNPFLRVLDIPRAAEIAHRHNARLIVDSTFATPVNQRPLELGADLVIHSATKYLGGHNDLLAGVVSGSAYLLAAVEEARGVLGNIADPHTAWLLLRGLKTLALRVEQQNRTALAVANVLRGHPAVSQVFYPGLPGHPDHQIATQQMTGFGGVVSFALNTDGPTTGAFIDRLRIPFIGPSLGGTESLVGQVALTTYYDLSPEERAELGVSDSLVRLAVGIEDAQDIINDIAQALDAVFGTTTFSLEGGFLLRSEV